MSQPASPSTPFSVEPARGPYDRAHVGVCQHADCLASGRPHRTAKKGSPDKAEAAIRDHLRDKHGVA